MGRIPLCPYTYGMSLWNDILLVWIHIYYLLKPRIRQSLSSGLVGSILKPDFEELSLWAEREAQSTQHPGGHHAEIRSLGINPSNLQDITTIRELPVWERVRVIDALLPLPASHLQVNQDPFLVASVADGDEVAPPHVTVYKS